MKKLFVFFCLFFSPFLISAQEQPAPADDTINVESTDSQKFNMSIDLKVKDGDIEKKILDNPVQHLAVSGKPVTLKITGSNFKAAVRLTLYQTAGDTLQLLAQSSISLIKEGKKQVLSAVRSMPIKAGEKVLFFPLGVLPNAEKTGYNCMLEMDVSKYQEKPVSQE